MQLQQKLTFSRIVLVAYEMPDEENLGVRYVAQALRHDGFAVELVALNGFADLGRVAQTILSGEPPLIGLSMSDHQVAATQLALVAFLRAQGYRGVIVAGGALATIARDELLAKHEGLDAIIRREGETPMVLVARALRDGRPIEQVPGLTTRAGEGSAYIEFAPMPVTRPWRGELPSVLGHRVARVLGSRGCNGGCSYCGSTAVRHDAVKEARRAGLPIAQIRELGLATQRHRPLSDFADEVAELYWQRDVRFFRMVDDHVLGPDAKAALTWLRELKLALEARQVTGVAFSMMVEPSVVTEAVADAMVELGVLRVLVGVESLTQAGLRALGRHARLLDDNRAVVTRLRDRGIAVFHNSIFLHPSSTPASIRAELEALPFVSGVPFDILPLLVFPGTGLYAKFEREGRLMGGLLGSDYHIDDPIVSRFRSLLHGTSRELPELMSLSISAFDVVSLEALARRFELTGVPRQPSPTLKTLIDRIGRLRQETAFELLQLAEDCSARAALVAGFADWVGPTRQRLGALSLELELHRRTYEELAQCHARSRPSDGVTLFARTMLAAGFVVMSPACGGEMVDAQTETQQGGSAAVASGGATSVTATSATNGGAVNTTATNGTNGGTSSATSTAASGGTGASAAGGSTIYIGDPTGGTAGTASYLSTSCDSTTHWAIARRLDSLAVSQCKLPGCAELLLRIDEAGQVTDVSYQDFSPYSTVEEWDAMRLCVTRVLAAERYPCLTDGFAWQQSRCLLLL